MAGAIATRLTVSVPTHPLGWPAMTSGSTRSTTRRRKHWGWGYEDEQPSEQELRDAAAFLSQRLGFGSTDVELPVPPEAVQLREPRLNPPPELAGICSTDTYQRALHSY